MADSPSPVLQLRIQSVGSNVNLWGGYINTDLAMLEQASKGYQSLVVTGDATVNWTNYATGNTGAAARLKLTGSPAGACALTFPGYHNFISVENATAQTVTIKCSGGTGVAIPAGEKALLYCDGVDYFNAAPTRMSGKLTNVTAGTAATDAVNKTQMEVAIANAALPATAGTVRNSLNDTTADYHAGKHAVTASGDLAAAFTTQNPGADEDLLLTLTHTPYWNAPRVVGNADTPVAALDRDIIEVRTSTGVVEIDLPASGRVKIVDIDGVAATSNITVDAPGSDTVAFDIIDTNYFEGIWQRRPSGTIWDLT